MKTLGFFLMSIPYFFSACATACATRSMIQEKGQAPTPINGDVSVPFTLYDNRILVDVKVNGRGPFTFLFDTGGSRSNTITPELAKELGIQMTTGEAASGAGSGHQPTWNTKVESYSVGTLVALDQAMIVLDMSAIKKAFAFPRLDGVIGFDVLKKSVTCIDYEKLSLTFKEAGGDCFPASAKVIVPLRIDHHSPMIVGAVNGIGGPIPAKFAVLDEIRLGTNLKIEHVLSRLPTTSGGFFAKSSLGGSALQICASN